jgi:hypothetical protein
MLRAWTEEVSSNLTGARRREMIWPSAATPNEDLPMSKHEPSRPRVGWVGVTLLALLRADVTTGAGDQAAPKPLPPEVVRAWEKAGAEVGWMGSVEAGVLRFRAGDEGKAGEVPGFRFVWKAGVLPKLAPPAAPFGLDIGLAFKVKDADLKELAALKHLQMLSLSHASKVTDAGVKEPASNTCAN